MKVGDCLSSLKEVIDAAPTGTYFYFCMISGAVVSVADPGAAVITKSEQLVPFYVKDAAAPNYEYINLLVNSLQANRRMKGAAAE